MPRKDIAAGHYFQEPGKDTGGYVMAVELLAVNSALGQPLIPLRQFQARARFWD